MKTRGRFVVTPVPTSEELRAAFEKKWVDLGWMPDSGVLLTENNPCAEVRLREQKKD